MTEEDFNQTSQYKQLSAVAVEVGKAEILNLFPIPVYVQQNAVEEDDIKICEMLSYCLNTILLPTMVFKVLVVIF